MNKLLIKTVACIVALFLFLEQATVSYAALPASVRGADSSVHVRTRPSTAAEFSINPEFGSIVEKWDGGSEGTVFVIEDAHTSLIAQQNIARIIGEIIRPETTDYRPQTEEYERFKKTTTENTERRRKTNEGNEKKVGNTPVRRIIENNIKAGGEMRSVYLQRENINVIASEAKQSQRSRRHFVPRDDREQMTDSRQQPLKDNQSPQSVVYGLRSDIILCAEGFSGDLGERIDAAFQSVKETDSRREIADILMHNSEMTGAQFAYLMAEKDIPFFGVETEKEYHKNLERFRNVIQEREKMHEVLDYFKAHIGSLKEKLYPSSLRRLETAEKEFKENHDIHYIIDLLNLAQNVSIPIDRYPTFAYLAKQPEGECFNCEELLNECDALQSEIKKTILTGDAKILGEFDHCLKLLDKMLTATLTRAEWEEWFQDRSLFLTQLSFFEEWFYGMQAPSTDKRFSLSSKRIKKALRSAYQFYRYVRIRDKCMVKNTWRKMKKEAADSAVLVTGGFHTEGITFYLREFDLSYVIIRPHVPTIDTRLSELYYQRAAGVAIRPVDIVSAIQAAHITLKGPFTDLKIRELDLVFFIDVLSLLIGGYEADAEKRLEEIRNKYSDLFDFVVIHDNGKRTVRVINLKTKEYGEVIVGTDNNLSCHQGNIRNEEQPGTVSGLAKRLHTLQVHPDYELRMSKPITGNSNLFQIIHFKLWDTKNKKFIANSNFKFYEDEKNIEIRNVDVDMREETFIHTSQGIGKNVLIVVAEYARSVGKSMTLETQNYGLLQLVDKYISMKAQYSYKGQKDAHPFNFDQIDWFKDDVTIILPRPLIENLIIPNLYVINIHPGETQTFSISEADLECHVTVDDEGRISIRKKTDGENEWTSIPVQIELEEWMDVFIPAEDIFNGQKKDMAETKKNDRYADYQKEPTVGVYPGGLDFSIIDLFPNLETVYYINKRPFRVDYKIPPLTYQSKKTHQKYYGEEAFDCMMSEYLRETKRKHISDPIQSSIIFGDLQNSQPQIGMEPFMRADLESRGATHITINDITEELQSTVPIFEIAFTDWNEKEHTIFYIEADLYKEKYLPIMEDMIDSKAFDLFFLKAFTGSKKFPLALLAGLKKGGLFIQQPHKGNPSQYHKKGAVRFEFKKEAKLGGKDTVWGKLGHGKFLNVYRLVQRPYMALDMWGIASQRPRRATVSEEQKSVTIKSSIANRFLRWFYRPLIKAHETAHVRKIEELKETSKTFQATIKSIDYKKGFVSLFYPMRGSPEEKIAVLEAGIKHTLYSTIKMLLMCGAFGFTIDIFAFPYAILFLLPTLYPFSYLIIEEESSRRNPDGDLVLAKKIKKGGPVSIQTLRSSGNTKQKISNHPVFTHIKAIIDNRADSAWLKKQAKIVDSNLVQINDSDIKIQLLCESLLISMLNGQWKVSSVLAEELAKNARKHPLNSLIDIIVLMGKDKMISTWTLASQHAYKAFKNGNKEYVELLREIMSYIFFNIADKDKQKGLLTATQLLCNDFSRKSNKEYRHNNILIMIRGIRLFLFSELINITNQKQQEQYWRAIFELAQAEVSQIKKGLFDLDNREERVELARACFHLGRSHHELFYDYDRAIEALESAIDFNAQEPVYYAYLHYAYLAKTIECINAKDSDGAETYHALARQELLLKKAHLDGDELPFYQGVIALLRGDTGEARSLLEDVFEHYEPEMLQTLYTPVQGRQLRECMVLIMLNKHVSVPVRTAIAQVLSIEGKVHLSRITASFVPRIRSAFEKVDYDTALEEIKLASVLHTRNKQIQEIKDAIKKIQRLLKNGDAAYNADNLTKARQCYERVYTLNPRDKTVMKKIKMTTDKIELAQESYAIINRVNSILMTARNQKRIGKFPQANANFKRAHELLATISQNVSRDINNTVETLGRQAKEGAVRTADKEQVAIRNNLDENNRTALQQPTSLPDVLSKKPSTYEKAERTVTVSFAHKLKGRQLPRNKKAIHNAFRLLVKENNHKPLKMSNFQKPLRQYQLYSMNIGKYRFIYLKRLDTEIFVIDFDHRKNIYKNIARRVTPTLQHVDEEWEEADHFGTYTITATVPKSRNTVHAFAAPVAVFGAYVLGIPLATKIIAILSIGYLIWTFIQGIKGTGEGKAVRRFHWRSLLHKSEPGSSVSTVKESEHRYIHSIPQSLFVYFSTMGVFVPHDNPQLVPYSKQLPPCTEDEIYLVLTLPPDVARQLENDNMLLKTHCDREELLQDTNFKKITKILEDIKKAVSSETRTKLKQRIQDFVQATDNDTLAALDPAWMDTDATLRLNRRAPRGKTAETIDVQHFGYCLESFVNNDSPSKFSTKRKGNAVLPLLSFSAPIAIPAALFFGIPLEKIMIAFTAISVLGLLLAQVMSDPSDIDIGPQEGSSEDLKFEGAYNNALQMKEDYKSANYQGTYDIHDGEGTVQFVIDTETRIFDSAVREDSGETRISVPGLLVECLTDEALAAYLTYRTHRRVVHRLGGDAVSAHEKGLRAEVDMLEHFNLPHYILEIQLSLLADAAPEEETLVSDTRSLYIIPTEEVERNNFTFEEGRLAPNALLAEAATMPFNQHQVLTTLQERTQKGSELILIPYAAITPELVAHLKPRMLILGGFLVDHHDIHPEALVNIFRIIRDIDSME